ncbi:MAG TPA: DUF309 domain-containing protein [Candidatus Binatia bacterium]|nr:DUF309 domain-containing protein [Candidatus Binatia bacterium]
MREGIRLFNEGRFFESHEELEGFYQQTEAANKPFLEGLILLAAAFRLFSDFHEVKGPVRMVYQALMRFENYPATFLEIRVDRLSATLEAWAKEKENLGEKPSSSKIPRIQLKRFRFFS